MNYELSLLIDSDDLKYIKAAQQLITLAKPVTSGPSAIWLAIDPFQSTEVTWEENYGIYASTVEYREGAKITKLSETPFPAQDAAYYTLPSSTVFNGPFSGMNVQRGSYGAQNDMPSSHYPTLTFGLTQSAMVNQKEQDRKPLSAALVLATQFITMTPLTTVYIWLQATYTSETMIETIVGKHAVATFGANVDTITLKYNPELGIFAPVSPTGEFVDHEAVSLVLPETI